METNHQHEIGTRRDAAQFVLQLPSELNIIEPAVTYLVGRCRAFAFDGSRLNLNFRVGVTEAIANAMLYGNQSDPAKLVRVEVALDLSRVVLHVMDEGTGFDPAVVPDPTLPDNLQGTGGRGLFLIHHLMDEVEYNECGNAVRLVLLRDAPRSGRPAPD